MIKVIWSWEVYITKPQSYQFFSPDSSTEKSQQYATKEKHYIYTRVHAQNTTVNNEVSKSLTRRSNENNYRPGVTRNKHQRLPTSSAFGPTINRLTVTQTVVNPRFPASPHVHLEAGLPRSLAEPTTIAHSLLPWQRHDVRSATFACVLSARFIFASVTLGWKGNKESETQNSLIGWIGGVTWLKRQGQFPGIRQRELRVQGAIYEMTALI
jgi:hypothetical protein